MDEVWRGRFWTVPFLYVGAWRRIMFPEVGRDIPFTIENYAFVDDFGRETVSLIRTFDSTKRRRFDAYMIYSEERGRIVDYLGSHEHLAVDLDLSVDPDGGLRLRSGDQRLLRGPDRVPLPARCSAASGRRPRVVRRRAGPLPDHGRRAEPACGRLFGYSGTFDAAWPAVAAGRVPAHSCRSARSAANRPAPAAATLSTMKPFSFLADAFEATSARELGERARAAEDLGVTTFVLPDHLVPQLAPVPYLATVAALTRADPDQRVRPQQRPPPPGGPRPGSRVARRAVGRPPRRRDRRRLERARVRARSACRSTRSGSARRGSPRRSRSSRAASGRRRSRSPASTTRSPTTTPTRSRSSSRTSAVLHRRRRPADARARGARGGHRRAGAADPEPASGPTRTRSPGRRPRRRSAGSARPPASGSPTCRSTSTRRSGRSPSPTTSAAEARKVIDRMQERTGRRDDRAGGHRLAAHLHRLDRPVRREVLASCASGSGSRSFLVG